MSRPVMARVDFDPRAFGIRVAVRIGGDDDESELMSWSEPTVQRINRREDIPNEAWTSMPEDVARALYEALADYFGGSGHDLRGLRKDYDAERARVDRLIGALIRGVQP